MNDEKNKQQEEYIKFTIKHEDKYYSIKLESIFIDQSKKEHIHHIIEECVRRAIYEIHDELLFNKKKELKMFELITDLISKVSYRNKPGSYLSNFDLLDELYKLQDILNMKKGYINEIEITTN